MITTSYFIDPPLLCGLLRRDVSEQRMSLRDMPTGMDPLTATPASPHGSHEAPLEGLPSTIHGQRALYRIDNNRFQSPPSALDYMFLGAAEDKLFVQGVREVMELPRRIIGRQQVVDDVDQTLALYICAQTSHGIRRQVMFELGLLVGMKEQAMINQAA